MINIGKIVIDPQLSVQAVPLPISMSNSDLGIIVSHSMVL